MWHVIRRDALRGDDFTPSQTADATADEVAELARQALEREGREGGDSSEALATLIARSRGGRNTQAAEGDKAAVPMLEPIHFWARQAAEAADAREGTGLREYSGGLGLVEEEELSSFAWHGDTVAVVPIFEDTRSVELRYKPSTSERARRDSIYNNYWEGLSVQRWWPWPEVEMSVDMVGFFADTDGGTISADLKLRSVSHPRSYRFHLKLAGHAAGFLVVKPLYRLARDLRVRARDPLWPARVRREEQRTADLPPLLRDLSPSSGQVIVLVHGLASTAAEMARWLAPLKLNAARFEHDTFISIDANATELSQLLEARSDELERIILLAHSRGGLVSRAAADLLPDPVAARTSIHTFGTPHTGTALADFATIVPLIHFLDFVRHPGDVVRAASRYLLPRTWRTPEGIAEMSPESLFIARMRRGAHKPLALLNTWGAEYQEGCGDAWWHRPFAAACAGILPTPNDLVVPEASSLGAGVGQGPLNAPSTHFDYLRLKQIHDYIEGVM